MTSTLTSLTPVLLGMAVGVLLRRTGVASETDGHFLLRVVFYVAQPALIFASISSVRITAELWVFPAVAAATFVVGFFVGLAVRRRLRPQPLQRPVFLTACMLINTGFVLPFIQALFGAEGVARLAAFEIGTTILGLTWVYGIAAKANPHHQGTAILGRRLLSTPLLYAVALGLLANVTHWRPPAGLGLSLDVLGATTGPLLTLAIGIVFALRRTDVHLAAGALLTKLGAGLVVAVSAIVVFDLHGVDLGVMVLLGVAPAGYSVVTFASLEHLDTRFAAGTLSLSLVLSLVLAIAVSAVVG